MTIPNELLQVRRSFIRIFGAFICLFIVFFAIPFSGFSFAGFALSALPGGTVAVWVIERMQADLLPVGSALISLSPLDPFFAQSAIAGALAFLFALPLIAYEFWAFVSPALRRHEKRGLVWFFIIALALLTAGIAFSYVVLLPLIMQGLYAFNPAGVIPLYGLRAVVSLATAMILGTSLIFLLPVVMVLLSRVGLVPPTFWRHYARYALFVAVIFSAIITPDGSGISMVILAIPIGTLYGFGYVGSVLMARRDLLSMEPTII